MTISLPAAPHERNHPVTTAPARPTLLGPDGQALAHTAESIPDGDWKPVRATDNAVVWERPRPAAVPVLDIDPRDQARAEADQILDAARAEADYITGEARSLRARTLGSADHEARVIRERAAAEAAQKEEKGKRLDVWMARAVIAGAVGLTATGEYSLARLAHFPKEVAWLLPFVIDIYVIQAFRRHRDIVQAIGLTIAANVVYHLAAAGMFGVTTDSHGHHRATWWLIAMVASIASVILWRMHVMTAPPKEDKRRHAAPAEAPRESEGAPAAAALTMPESAPAAAPVESVRVAGESTDASARESTDASADESAVESSDESTDASSRESDQHSHPAPRESAPGRSHRRPPRRRESTPKAPAIGTPESEVDALVTLMRQRGGADAVTLNDAKRIAAGRSEATAARRLQAARTQYAK